MQILEIENVRATEAKPGGKKKKQNKVSGNP